MDQLESARAVLGLVWKSEELPDLGARVVDFGCHNGEWLLAAKELRAGIVLGVDYRPPSAELLIPTSEYVQTDLTWSLELPGEWDLAICTEVAEHLPEAAADLLVGELCATAPTVVFSAATPGQGPYGDGQHVNEQFEWYWEEKFKAHGFQLRDVVRPKVWDYSYRVDWWYRANLVVYSSVKPEFKDEITFVSRTLLRKWIEGKSDG